MEKIINLLNDISYTVNFFACLTIYIGTTYIALKNKYMPKWHITALYYVGLSAMINVLSIGCEWIFGSEFQLSYNKMGIIGESLLNLSIAGISFSMFMYTVVKKRDKLKNT